MNENEARKEVIETLDAIDENTPVIAVLFDQPGSTNLTPITLNVTPHQLLLAGHILVELATLQLHGQWAMQQQARQQNEAHKKIAVAKAMGGVKRVG